MEYENMKKNLDIILDNIVILAKQFGFKEEIDKFTLMELLISDGYLTKDRKFVVNEDILYRDLYDDIIFELGVVPFTGEGCCRHTTSLAKLILDRFNIENEVSAALITDKEINSKELIAVSDMVLQPLDCNHAVNIVKIDDRYMAFDVDVNKPIYLYSIKENKLTGFFQKESLNSSYLIYNYSPFFEGKRNFNSITPLSILEQEDIIRNHNNTLLVARANIDLLEEFYTNNRPYMEEIDNSYKKILVKERGL